MPSILERQAGIISREQAVDAGMTDNDIRRLVRQRRWQRVHPGVYVDHTGPPTWLQRAWAAVLFCGPAALCHESARRAADGPGRAGSDGGRIIHVAVDHRRTVRAPAGVRVHRVVDLDAQVTWHTSPPRQRLEHAVIALTAAAPRDIDAVARISEAVGARLTTADRLISALADTPRVRRRRFLAAVLADVGAGTCSALEHGYLTRVERTHGLPTAGRQVRESAKGVVYRDVEYADQALLVELDGRIHARIDRHDGDLERDLAAALSGRATVRLGWGQVFDRGCATAEALALLLRARGWRGQARRCPRCPEVVTRAA